MNALIGIGIFLGLLSVISLWSGILNLPTVYLTTYISENNGKTDYRNCESTIYGKTTYNEMAESIKETFGHEKVVIISRTKK